MIAANLMTTEVITMKPDDTLHKAFELCNENKIRQVPVLDSDNKVISVITAKKILKSVLPGYITKGYLKDVKFAPELPELLNNMETLLNKKISEVIEQAKGGEEQDTFRTVSPDTSTTELATMFVNKDNPISCIIVTDDNGVMLGIISPWDLFKKLWNHLENSN